MRIIKSLLFVLGGVWMMNVVQAATNVNLTDYEQQDLLAIREVAVASYRNQKTNSLRQTGEIIRADTRELVGSIYEHPRCYIVGYSGFLGGDWFTGQVNADAFGFSGTVRKDCADTVYHSRNCLQDLVHGFDTTKDIVFTGFKEGGAMAGLSAADISSSFTQGLIAGDRGRIKLVTFNPSSLGDAQFAADYKNVIPLKNSLAFVNHDDYPRQGKSFADFGKVGLPVRILASESWTDLYNKSGAIMAQGSIIIIGGSTITILGGVITSAVAIPVTIGVAYKLPAWLGIEPYGVPSAETVGKAFRAVKAQIQRLGYEDSLELAGQRPISGSNVR